jgi:hypothetical protein
METRLVIADNVNNQAADVGLRCGMTKVPLNREIARAAR